MFLQWKDASQRCALWSRWNIFTSFALLWLKPMWMLMTQTQSCSPSSFVLAKSLCEFLLLSAVDTLCTLFAKCTQLFRSFLLLPTWNLYSNVVNEIRAEILSLGRQRCMCLETIQSGVISQPVMRLQKYGNETDLCIFKLWISWEYKWIH